MAGSTARTGGLFSAAFSGGTAAAALGKAHQGGDRRDDPHHHPRRADPPANAHDKSRRLLGQAPRLLRQVEDSYLLRKSAPQRSAHRAPAASAAMSQQLRLVLGSGPEELCRRDQHGSSSPPHAPHAHRFPPSLPAFDRAEVVVGPLLGVGGFCSVYQVDSFDLKKSRGGDAEGDRQWDEAEESHRPAQAEANEEATGGGEGGGPASSSWGSPDDRFWSGRKRFRGAACSPGSVASSSATTPASSGHSISTLDSGSHPFLRDEDPNHRHHHRQHEHGTAGGAELTADRARELMRMRARRRRPVLPPPGVRNWGAGGSGGFATGDRSSTSLGGEFGANAAAERTGGEARYAIKKLHLETLGEFERTRGTIDLAMEALYLSALSHPNISTCYAKKDCGQ
jgi:hypothetical protein